jgi:hypothetical protein
MNPTSSPHEQKSPSQGYRHALDCPPGSLVHLRPALHTPVVESPGVPLVGPQQGWPAAPQDSQVGTATPLLRQVVAGEEQKGFVWFRYMKQQGWPGSPQDSVGPTQPAPWAMHLS